MGCTAGPKIAFGWSKGSGRGSGEGLGRSDVEGVEGWEYLVQGDSWDYYREIWGSKGGEYGVGVWDSGLSEIVDLETFGFLTGSGDCSQSCGVINVCKMISGFGWIWGRG